MAEPEKKKGILAFGKPEAGDGLSDADEAPASSGDMGKSSAARALLAAIEAKDSTAMSEALTSFVSQCSGSEDY